MYDSGMPYLPPICVDLTPIGDAERSMSMDSFEWMELEQIAPHLFVYTIPYVLKCWPVISLLDVL